MSSSTSSLNSKQNLTRLFGKGLRNKYILQDLRTQFLPVEVTILTGDHHPEIEAMASYCCLSEPSELGFLQLETTQEDKEEKVEFIA